MLDFVFIINLSLFIYPLSTAFEKVCGGIFDPCFDFFRFLENYPSQIFVFNELKEFEKMPCISGYAQFVMSTFECMALGIVKFEHPNDKGLLNGYLISIKRTREVLSGEAVTVNKKDFLVQLTELQRKDLPLKVSFIIKKVQSLKASFFFIFLVRAVYSKNGMISIAILYRPGSRLFPFKTSLNLHMKVNVLHEVIFNG